MTDPTKKDDDTPPLPSDELPDEATLAAEMEGEDIDGESDEDEEGSDGKSGKKGGGGKKVGGKKKDFDDVLVLSDDDLDPENKLIDKVRMLLMSPFDIGLNKEDAQFRNTMAHKLRGIDDGLHLNDAEAIDLVNRQEQEKAKLQQLQAEQQKPENDGKVAAAAAAIAAAAVVALSKEQPAEAKEKPQTPKQEQKVVAKEEQKLEDKKASEKHEQDRQQQRPAVKEEDPFQAEKKVEIVRPPVNPNEQDQGILGTGYMSYAIRDSLMNNNQTQIPPQPAVDYSNFPPPNYSIKSDFNTAGANMNQLMQGITMRTGMEQQAPAPALDAAGPALAQSAIKLDSPLKMGG